ncbi:MAG: hypothetical protein JSU96_21345 [Acidobacteriota bacterium]|nr:MAG: hypothetical protein JSU96_21345 [Acidobacteriota bacterium]
MSSGHVQKIKQLPWVLWIRQVQGIILFELRRSLTLRRSPFVYLLALAPLALLSLRLFFPTEQEILDGIGGINVMFAIIFRAFYLRLAVFFGCVGVFMRLFRGDVLEKTLHYYFLTSVRREILVVGKYISGVLLNFIIFGGSVAVAFFLLYLPSGWVTVEEFVFKGPGMGHLFSYVGVTFLACIGYGAVFLLMGLFFRNPIVPASVILGWEYINFLLPPYLKKISVIYYLESLCPVPIPSGPVTILAEPAPFWLAVPGLLGLTLVVLVIAGLKIRQMEISYGEE